MKHDYVWPSLSRLRSTKVSSFADVLAALTYLVLADLLLIALPAGSAARAIASLPLLFFLPGYAIVAAVFPRRAEPSRSGVSWRGAGDVDDRRGIGWIDRGVLSVGTSIAVLSIVGVAIVAVGADLTAGQLIVAAVEGIVLVGLVIGLLRRLRLPVEERFRVPVRSLAVDFAESVSSSRPWPDRLLRFALVVLVLASAVGLTYAVVSPPTAERYTTLMVLTENESGEYVAGDYPTGLTPGQEASLVVGIENHEGKSVDYTVVPVLQQVERAGDSLRVLDEQRSPPLSAELDPDETVYLPHSFVPEVSGPNLRIVYLLYAGAPPDTPTIDSAHRYVQVWVNASTGGG